MIHDLYNVDAEGRLKLSFHKGQLQAWDSEKRFIFILAGTQAGKSIALDTEIPTPDGFVELRHIMVGDRVFDESGNIVRVIYTSPVYENRKCYRVTFDDGSWVIADAEHLWETQTFKQRKNQRRRMPVNPLWSLARPQCKPTPDSSIMTTEEILETQFDLRGTSNHSIVIAKPINYPWRDLPIPPYVLGAWLGDGSSDNPLITIGDDEVREKIAESGVEINKVPYDANTGAATMYRIGTFSHTSRGYMNNNVKDALRELGVLKNKHIPEIYLRASADQRLDLMRGLMDTDGYCATDGACEFTTTKEIIATGFVELANSIGIKCRVYLGRAILNGRDCGPKWRIGFTTSTIVFNIDRKRARQNSDRRADMFNRYIVAVEPVESVPVRCIQVDSPSHLYLVTRSYIVTHNTSYGPWWLWKQIKKYGAGDYLAVTSTFPLLRLKMLPEFLKIFHNTLQLGKWWAADRVYELANPDTGEMAERATDPMWGRVIFGSAKNADSLESATAKAAWLDEVGQNDFRIDAWEAVLRRLSLNQGPVLGSTTLYNWGWMKQQIYDPWKRGESDEIDVIQFRSIENPSFPKEEYYRAKRNMPPWKFKMFYEGLYDKPAGMIYDSFEYDERTVVPPFQLPNHWPLYVGLDFGGVNMAAIFTAMDPDTKIFYHFNEYLAGGRSILQHAKEFKKIVGDSPYVWVGGAAPEDQWRVEFREAGIPVFPPPIADVEVGIQRVYGYHRRHQIRVFNTLTRYLDQKGSYSRELDDLNQPTEKIEDKNAYHMMDAERVLFSYLWERQGGADMDLLQDIMQATPSRWSTVRSPMTHVVSDTGSRWQRGRKF